MKELALKDLDVLECFKGCTQDEIREISALMTPCQYDQDSFVYREKQKTDKVYFVLKGTLKMLKYSQDNMRPTYLGQLSRGDMFAIGEVFFDEYYITVTCTEDCELLSMHKNDFHRLWHTIPAFQEYITHALAHIARGNFFFMERMEAESQMKYLLYYFATQDSKIEGDEVVITPPINQIQMAEILNITREHVSRIFRVLKSEGILIQNQPRIILSKDWYLARKADPDYDESLHRYYRID